MWHGRLRCQPFFLGRVSLLLGDVTSDCLSPACPLCGMWQMGSANGGKQYVLPTPHVVSTLFVALGKCIQTQSPLDHISFH